MMKLKIVFLIILLLHTSLWAAPATMYVTPAGAGTKDGLSWANAFGFAEFETDYETLMEAGDIYYIGQGTYTLTSGLVPFASGTAIAPIKLIGVETGTTNWVYGVNRPDFSCNAYNFAVLNSFHAYNFILTGTDTIVFGSATSDYSTIYNLKSTNSSVTSGRFAIKINDYCHVILCEGISTNGQGLASDTRSRIMYCYAHDSSTGINIAAGGSGVCFNSIIDTCTTGIYLSAMVSPACWNNTIYNCATGISATTSYIGSFGNNIISSTGTGHVGASWGTATPSNFWAYNLFYLPNGTKRTNVAVGVNDIDDQDPLLNNPANSDFTLQAASPALNAGMQPNTNIGVVGSYPWNIGADQDDNTAAGAGGATSYGFVQ